MAVEVRESTMGSFIDSLARATADILTETSSPLTTSISSSAHVDSLSLLSTLADLASTKSPVKQQPNEEEVASSGPGERRLRPRAMSESWASEDPWKKNVQLAQSQAPDATGIILPYMLDKYSSIYNKHGRIGVYSREERDEIINRFREKRRRRVWKKSIRYHCRKNLADRRVRVKGRFVRAGSMGSEPTTDRTPSNMEELLLAAAQEGEDSAEEASERTESAASSFSRSAGLELLERAIQFDEDDDSKLLPGKRMRRHTIV